MDGPARTIRRRRRRAPLGDSRRRREIRGGGCGIAQEKETLRKSPERGGGEGRCARRSAASADLEGLCCVQQRVRTETQTQTETRVEGRGERAHVLIYLSATTPARACWTAMLFGLIFLPPNCFFHTRKKSSEHSGGGMWGDHSNKKEAKNAKLTISVA